MYFVYVLRSLKDNRTYVGYTNDLERRFKQHNAGLVKSTKHRVPFVLLYSEQLVSLAEAKKRELWWKSGSGRRYLKNFFT